MGIEFVPLPAIDLHATQGDAVLTLLERAAVPPLPCFYQLFYDYVAGVEGLMSFRMDEILVEGNVRERVYAEFVAPYETREPVERAIATTLERLRTLEKLIEDSVSASHRQSASLQAATLSLAGAPPKPKLLHEWVARLTAANNELRDANAVLMLELDSARDELVETRAEVERHRAGTRVDPLTGLANRAGLDLELGRLLALHRETGESLIFAVIDIDHFKSLNDTYGHQRGDEVLRIVSRALLASLRQVDVVGRTGGDEFLVVFPATELEAARASADRIRAAVLETDLHSALGAAVLGGATVSVGLARWRVGDGIGPTMERADRALYEAKRQGRNRVISDTDLDTGRAA